MKIIAVLSIAALAISGCVGMTPALAGKTKITTEFRDIATADNATDTHYSQSIVAPAGVDAKELNSFSYDWDEKTGKITVSQDRSVNTLGQAEALIQVNAQQTQLINSLTQALISAAAPIVGTKVQGDVQNQAASIANRAQLQALVADLVGKALAQQGAATDQYQVRLPR